MESPVAQSVTHLTCGAPRSEGHIYARRQSGDSHFYFFLSSVNLNRYMFCAILFFSVSWRFDVKMLFNKGHQTCLRYGKLPIYLCLDCFLSPLYQHETCMQSLYEGWTEIPEQIREETRVVNI